MSGWKANDSQANNEPSYLIHIGRDQAYTNAYSANTILITASRLANANIAFGMSTKQSTHTGWVNYQKSPNGRIRSEVLVCLSNPSSANANAALPWFTGV